MFLRFLFISSKTIARATTTVSLMPKVYHITEFPKIIGNNKIINVFVIKLLTIFKIIAFIVFSVEKKYEEITVIKPVTELSAVRL